MKKIFRITAIVFITLLLFLAVAPILFKGKIIRTVRNEVNKNLNAEVYFSDDVSIGLFRSFPKLSLGLKELRVTGKDTFSLDTLAEIPSLSVTLDLMSVIKGDRIEVNSVTLEQPRISLQVLQNGMANWDIALPDSAMEDTTPSAFRLGLNKLEIKKGTLVYNDRSIPFKTELREFDHTMKGDFTLDRFVMETSTQAASLTLGYGGVDYISRAVADLTVNLDMDMKYMKFSFMDNKIILNALELAGEGFVDLNEEDMEFDLDFRSTKTDFRTLMSMVPGVFKKDFANAKASGNVAFSGYMKGKMADDKMPAYGLNLDVDKGTFSYPDLPKTLNDVFIDLKVDNPSGNTNDLVVNLSRFDAVIAGEPLHAAVLLKNPVSEPYTEGEIKGRVNLSEFRNMIPLEPGTNISGIISSDVAFKGTIKDLEKGDVNGFHAEGTLGAAGFSYSDPVNLPRGTQFDAFLVFHPRHIVLESLQGKAGMSDFKTKGRIDNLFGFMLRDELLQGEFSLVSDYFNANEFLTEGPVKEEPATTDSLPLQAFDVPGNIDFSFASNIGTLIYDNMKMTDLHGKVIIRDKQLMFENLGVNLLEGSMSMNGVYDSHNPKFPFSKVDFQVKSIDILESFKTFDLIRKFIPIASYTHGHFNADIKLSNNFNENMSVSYPSVSGVIRLALTEAAIKDLPVLNILADKLKIDKLKNLTLKKQSLKLSLLSGKAMLDSMVLPLWPGAKANISGYTALDHSIKYVARLSVPRKDFGEANTALNALTDQAIAKGIPVKISDIVDVDVLIGGMFNKPEVKVSLHDAKANLLGSVRDQLADEAEKRKQAAIEEAKRKAAEARKKTEDSLNRLKQQALDKAAAEKKALEDKAAEEKRKAEEKAREEAEKARKEAERKLEEEKKKLEEEKKKALDKLKGGILK